VATRAAQIRYAVYGVVAGAAVMAFGAYEYVRTEGWPSLIPMVVLLCAVIAIAWFSLALFWDAAHGRRRCPKCWYDMSATDGLRCPECGRTAKYEKRLHRTRRHWRLALLAVIPALLSAYLLLLPRIREHGVQSIVPTTVLIWCLDLEYNEWAFEELGRRALRIEDKFMPFYAPKEGALYDWQWRAIGRKSIELIESDLPAGHRYGLFDWITRTKWALQLQGDSFVEELNAALVRLLDDPDPRIRGWCAIYIADINDPDRSIEILRALLNDDSTGVRRAATAGLSLLAESREDAMLLVATALGDTSKDVRLGALGALGGVAESRMLPDAIIQQVRELAHDRDPSVREYQVVTIVRIVDSDQKRNEISSAIRSEDTARRSGAYSVLAYDEHAMATEFLPELAAGLSDPSDEARRSAAIALSYAEPAALEPFEERIKAGLDPDQFPDSAASIRYLLVDIHHMRTGRLLDELDTQSEPAEASAD